MLNIIKKEQKFYKIKTDIDDPQNGRSRVTAAFAFISQEIQTILWR